MSCSAAPAAPPKRASRSRQLKPDLLLLDVNLPDGSGLDVLRQLRARARAPEVILLTAGMDESQLLAAADLEPEGMVLKTSDPGLLHRMHGRGRRAASAGSTRRSPSARAGRRSAPPRRRR